MPIWLSLICDQLTTCWLNATPADYGRVLILVIVTGWILSRAQSETKPVRRLR